MGARMSVRRLLVNTPKIAVIWIKAVGENMEK